MAVRSRIAAAVAATAALVVLGGCVGTRLQAPVLPAGTGDSFRFVEVRVDAARAVERDQGRRFQTSEAEVERIIGAAALDVLDDFDGAGTRDVIANVLISRLFVPSPASAGLTARGAAAAGATVLLQDATTGEAIGEPFGLRAHGPNRFGGILGAVLTAQALSRNGEAGEIAIAGQSLGFEMVEAIYQIDPRDTQ